MIKGMKKTCVVILCLCLTTLSPMFVRAEGQIQAVPVIEVENPTHDFDEVVQGKVVKHEFRVLNQGSAELLIHHVSPD